MADDLDIEAMLEAPYRKVRVRLSSVSMTLSAGLYCSRSSDVAAQIVVNKFFTTLSTLKYLLESPHPL
uniref:Uncharacterized protein n=1 Tax=Labrus bergylta TaxID=56723 RepID=A0A3Q3ESP8_9LABR